MSDYENTALLEPFFNYDEDSGLFSINLVSSEDKRVMVLRLDEESVVGFFQKFRHFLVSHRALEREDL